MLPQFVFARLGHHLCTGILVPLLPLLRQDFALTYFQSGLLTTAFAVAYGFGQLPVVALSGKVGQRTLIIVGLIGMSTAAIGAGLARDYNQLLALRVLMGLFGSGYHALSSSFLSHSFSKERRGQILGLHIVGGNFSSLIAPLVAVLLASLSGSWRIPFILLALPALVAGLVVWARVPATGAAQRGEVRDFVQGASGWRGIVRRIGLLLMLDFLLSLVAFSMYSFFPLYLTDKHGVSFAQAGVLTGIMVGVGIIGSPLGGGISDRLGRQRVILMAVISAGPLFYLLTAAPMGLWFLGALAAFGIVVSLHMPAMESLMADHVPAAHLAMALAVYYFFSQETSSVMTAVVGRLTDLHGLGRVFQSLALFACVVSAVALGKMWGFGRPSSDVH